MNILITNDDGIHAPGLRALKTRLEREHQVLVVAPETEQSAVGHAITLTRPIKVRQIKENGALYGHAVGGTPADCVKIALAELMEHKPDLVVSGINLGANVGVNLLYSGTVSAASEAVICGIAALAVSLNTFLDPDFGPAAQAAARLIGTWGQLGLARGVAVNMNVPALAANEIKPAVWARQATQIPREYFVRRRDPRGNTYFWLGGEALPEELEPDTDLALLNQGFITLTPIHHDLTHHGALARLKKPGSAGQTPPA